MIRLTREDRIFEYQHGGHAYRGRRGLWIVGPISWPTVELVSVDGRPYVWVRPGLYKIAMAKMKVGRPALRVLADGLPDSYPAATLRSLRAGRIYAHGVDATLLLPHHLRGCIGIGTDIADLGVKGSSGAISQIARALDPRGFVEGLVFDLEVINGD